MSYRLPPRPGEWIDRSRRVRFCFEGREYEAFAGDTMTSALLANGVRVLGRSFKYHRPRGVLSLANHDANALVQIGARLNVRADSTPISDGLDAVAVNTFGGLEKDRARFLDRLSPFLPVGFYYKAFHSKRWFPRWERMFRAIAGLGRVEHAAEALKTPKRYGFCDVLVVGAGPSGLCAAQAAADAGARVVLVDENAQIGGSATYQGAYATIADLAARIAAHPNISVRAATVAAGYYADHWVPLVDEHRMTKLRARAVVVCAGVFEQPAVFRNNDLPGVMLASAAQRLIHRYAVKPFDRVVVLAGNLDGYTAALDLAQTGIGVAALVDIRTNTEDAPMRLELERHGIPVRRARTVSAFNEAIGLAGMQVDGASIACDGIAMSVGYAPAAGLLYQAGGKMRYAAELEQYVPQELPAGIFAAGRVNGVYELSERMQDGARAGAEAARFLGFAPGPFAVSERAALAMHSAEPPNHPYPVFPHPKGKEFVDFDEDVVLANLHNAAQEGFDSIELMKRYTTLGMGPSQGKHSNMNGARVLARIRGEPVEAIGLTTARPFFHPVPLAILAGRGFQVERRTPLHSRHEALGARFMHAGEWLRPEFYAVPGKTRDECIRHEALAIRQRVGLIDVGTLGKLELSGPDAVELLERVYTGRYANLRVGMTRYALMLDEAGVVIDDGVIARMAEERFYFTTTTSGSASVYRELVRLLTQWRLRCGIVNHTGHLGAINIAGPRSRSVLAKLSASDLSETAFPYLAVREIVVAGIPVRAMRVGFVGEIGYELHAPTDRTGPLWDALMRAGAEECIRPFGVEAQRLLRLEKGHIIIGQDTDGLTTPAEAGCGWALKMDKPFFIGQRSLRIVAQQPLRQVLAGFKILGDAAARVQECHLAIERAEIAGRVTSYAWSPILSRYIGLAMLRPDLAQRGYFDIRVTEGSIVRAKVVRTPFYDADGQRQRLPWVA